MRRYADRAAEATLANHRIPQAKRQDPDDVESVSTAITRLQSWRAGLCSLQPASRQPDSLLPGGSHARCG
jgi:hypothetical protein